MEYINEDTGEWGLLIGDVELDPTASWAEIIDTPAPDCEFHQQPYLLPPIKIDGKWHKQWTVVDLSQKQIDIKNGIITEE